MNKLISVVAVVVGTAAALPASAQITSGSIAQNKAECQAQFRVSDLNGDNFLTPREISLFRGSMPTELSGREVIHRQDFISACYATLPQDD